MPNWEQLGRGGLLQILHCAHVEKRQLTAEYSGLWPILSLGSPTCQRFANPTLFKSYQYSRPSAFYDQRYCGVFTLKISFWDESSPKCYHRLLIITIFFPAHWWPAQEVLAEKERSRCDPSVTWANWYVRYAGHYFVFPWTQERCFRYQIVCFFIIGRRNDEQELLCYISLRSFAHIARGLLFPVTLLTECWGGSLRTLKTPRCSPHFSGGIPFGTPHFSNMYMCIIIIDGPSRRITYHGVFNGWFRRFDN